MARLNLHKKNLYIYSYFNDYDGLRKINIFEDLDETFPSFNLNSKKVFSEYSSEISEKTSISIKKIIKQKKYNTFENEYF